MKKIKAFKCNCGKIYEDDTKIYSCKICGKEICISCEGYRHKVCNNEKCISEINKIEDGTRMRKIIKIIAGRGLDLSKYIDLTKIKINRLWTVYDEEQMWESSKFNTQTGELVTTLEDLTLQHHKGVFLEDKIHDWDIRNGKLDYCSRVVEIGAEIKILIEYDNI